MTQTLREQKHSGEEGSVIPTFFAPLGSRCIVIILFQLEHGNVFFSFYVQRVKPAMKYFKLRIVIGVWIIYCLIISSAYSGNLKAFLTTPSFSDPMNSLKDVVESGLPWGMVLYGEDEERLMQQSQDPIIQTIWREKIEEPYRPVPPVRFNITSR